MSLSGTANSESISHPGQRGPLAALVRRHPVLTTFLLVLLSNVAGSIFNILYNDYLILRRYLPPELQAYFWNVLLPVYNVLAYPLCLALVVYKLLPLYRSERLRRAGQPVPESLLAETRLLLVNAPYYGLWISTLGWVPGAIFFPALLCWAGGYQYAWELWLHFGISFTVSALLTTVQTFFLLEAFCIRFLYPAYFGDVRPAQIEGGGWGFGFRLFLLWGAVGLMPLLSLLVVALNVRGIDEVLQHVRPLESEASKAQRDAQFDVESLRGIALGVFFVGSITGGLIALVVGKGLLRWLKAHANATEQVARGNFQVRIREQRPDEWGQLTDRFNDMTGQLAQAEEVRETFGQIVHPDVRDEMMERYKGGLGGEVREVTVLFADIRGFTSRSAGQPPERVVALLNRFLTLAVGAIEDAGGRVNKFLGDGVMALFGAPRPRDNHADLAILAALELLWRLDKLNEELRVGGEPPLVVGIGIHTGSALVGCVGATILIPGGKTSWRREFTAIGETINLGQRLEQLTKTCGGPILLSEQTRARLRRPVLLIALGEQEIPGHGGKLRVYRVEAVRKTGSGVWNVEGKGTASQA